MRTRTSLLLAIPTLAAATLLVAPGALITSRAVAAGGASVSIVPLGASCASEYCYQPASVSAASGDTVTWTNNSPASHTVTRCDPSACHGQGPGTGSDALSSAEFGQGQTFSHAFAGGGTYFYYCTVHGYDTMHGEVTVAGSTTTSTTTHTTQTTTSTPSATTTQTSPPTAAPTHTPAPTPTPQPTSSATTSSTTSTAQTSSTDSSSSSAVALAPSSSTSSSSTDALAATPSSSSDGGHTGLAVGLLAVLLIAGGIGTLVWLNRERIPFLRGQ